MHELLHDVIANQLEPMNSLEEKIVTSKPITSFCTLSLNISMCECSGDVVTKRPELEKKKKDDTSKFATRLLSFKYKWTFYLM